MPYSTGQVATLRAVPRNLHHVIKKGRLSCADRHPQPCCGAIPRRSLSFPGLKRRSNLPIPPPKASLDSATDYTVNLDPRNLGSAG